MKKCRMIGVIWMGLACAPGLFAQYQAEHPFLLWTAEEAAAIRHRIKTDPIAKQQLDRMNAIETSRLGYPSLFNLFKCGVLGDKTAGESEKRALLAFVGKLPPAGRPGDPASGNLTYRDDRTIEALRFDILYDLLNEEERQAILRTIKAYVDWFEEMPGSFGSRGAFPRTGWLPNMQWPTYAGIHVLAVASRDPALIERVFEMPRGWKWFFDVYIADGRFYMEEFAKYGSNIGAMILWCEGLERLGLSRFGYGYTGKGGATMKEFLRMLMWCGYPRIVERTDDMPDYPCVMMGDAGQIFVVNGRRADGSGGMNWFATLKMWGPTKMLQPLWWEAGHRRFPDAGFDYFLAQLRAPDQAHYLPSLYFGLGAIDPKQVKPPPAPSYIAPERGFALLRMDESPDYWESPRPAVALQFGSYYVHYVHDCFSLLGYVAHNRNIYQRLGGTTRGYAGGDPWRDHVRGQASGVVVDGLQAQPIDRGERGIENQQLRHAFGPLAKFTAIRAKPVEIQTVGEAGTTQKSMAFIYPDVDCERALVLTDDYLLDLFNLVSDRPRVYDWHVMAAATLHQPDAGWLPLADSPAKDRADKPHLTNVRVLEAGNRPWSVTLRQDHLPRNIGVIVRMLEGGDTVLVSGRPPITEKEIGTKLIAVRYSPRTLFAALHEPVAGDHARVKRFERVAQTEHGIVVRIVGNGFEDSVMVRFGGAPAQTLTLGGDGETYAFDDFAFLRVLPDRVEAWGDIKHLRMRVPSKRRVTVNGREHPVEFAAGMIEWRHQGNPEQK